MYRARKLCGLGLITGDWTVYFWDKVRHCVGESKCRCMKTEKDRVHISGMESRLSDMLLFSRFLP